MSFRREEKIRLTAFEQQQLQQRLQRQGMQPLYPPRIVHSLYLDNYARQILHDAEEGMLPRKKIRLRHYEAGQNPSSIKQSIEHQLEVKTSSVEGRFKTTERLSPQRYAHILRNGLLDTYYGQVSAVLQVRYRRAYFALQGLRITLDSELQYARHQGSGENLHSSQWLPDTHCVLEIKAPAHSHPDFLQRCVPYPRQRFSKYANGMLLLQLDSLRPL